MSIAHLKFKVMLNAFINETREKYGREPTAKEIQMLVNVLKEFNVDLPMSTKGEQK
jgi:hypothetical protein